MSIDTVLVERDGPVAIMRLHVPDKLNALSLELQARMREVFAALAADASVRALVITGAGKAFCVGADLAGMRPSRSETRTLGHWAADTMLELSNQLIQDIRALPFPVVAAVNGPCAGAGVGLALAADVVMAGQSAYFFLSFMPRLGIVPDLGVSWFLERFIGRPRAVAMSLLGDRISAEQAAQWGLVWACVSDQELLPQAIATAQRLANAPAHAAQEIRGLFDSAASQDLSAQLRYEADRQRVLLDRAEFREGVKAFTEKREPNFPARG